MRKWYIYLLSIGCAVILYFTVFYTVKVLNAGLAGPGEPSDPDGGYRFVLITRERDTPFWNQVKDGALASAERNGVSLEAWGSYNRNEDEFMKNLDIAIASKVDGIIVQGLDTFEFKQLTMYRATESGIPVITVANDVPMNESLRKTYVGSNHYESGQMIARQLLSDMGFSGKVVLMAADRQEEFQRSRLNGIIDALSGYPNIQMEIVATGTTREEIVQATNQYMNQQPDIEAIVTTTGSNVSAVIQELGKRSKVEPYYIYSFDDNPEAVTLLQQGKIDALIAQSPEAMGRESVDLMVRWLKGEMLPLNSDGYYTDIRVLKAGPADE